jgi:hypothetical protein
MTRARPTDAPDLLRVGSSDNRPRGDADGRAAPRSLCGPDGSEGDARVRGGAGRIPGNYLRWIRQAGDRYGLDWSVIAGIYSIETDFGRSDAPGVRSGENSAGTGGPGQFLDPTWRICGVDGDSDSVKDRDNPADAIPGTANLLARSGAPADYRRAIFAYNHATWYVDDVLTRAARYRGAAEGDPDAVQAALVADATAAETCAELVAGRPGSSRQTDLPGGVSGTPRLGDGRGSRPRAGRRPDLQRRRGCSGGTTYA